MNWLELHFNSQLTYIIVSYITKHIQHHYTTVNISNSTVHTEEPKDSHRNITSNLFKNSSKEHNLCWLTFTSTGPWNGRHLGHFRNFPIKWLVKFCRKTYSWCYNVKPILSKLLGHSVHQQPNNHISPSPEFGKFFPASPKPTHCHPLRPVICTCQCHKGRYR